jgi:hypothetical protein
MILGRWLGTSKLFRNRLLVDYSAQFGQHPVTSRDATCTENALIGEVGFWEVDPPSSYSYPLRQSGMDSTACPGYDFLANRLIFK